MNAFSGEIQKNSAEVQNPKGGEFAAPFVTAIPEGWDHQAGSILLAPAFGVKGSAARRSAMNLAQASGRPVVAYIQNWSSLEDPARDSFPLAARTAGAVMEAQKKLHMPVPRILVAVSAGANALAGVLAEDPGKLDVGVFDEAMGFDLHTHLTPEERGAFYALPLEERGVAIMGSTGGTLRGLRQAGRFVGNNLLQTPSLLLDPYSLYDAMQGYPSDLRQTLVRRDPKLPRALMMTGNNSFVPEAQQAREQGTGVHLVHGEADRVFPTSDIRATAKDTGIPLEIVPAGHTFPGSRNYNAGHPSAIAAVINSHYQ